VAPKGEGLLFSQSNPVTGGDIWFLPFTGDRKARPVVDNRFNEGTARLSPDGRWLAYVSDESGRAEVYVQAFPGATTSQRVSQSGGTLPKWSADGSRIYFLSPDAWIMEAPVSRQRGAISVGVPVRVVPASGQDFMPSSDGRRFLLLESAKPRSLALVNWRSLLPRQ